MNIPGKPIYQAVAAVNVIISAVPAILKRIIIGADVTNSVIEISDSVSDGNGNTILKLSGSTLMTANGGVVEVNAEFHKGIATDITLQSDITFIIEYIN